MWKGTPTVKTIIHVNQHKIKANRKRHRKTAVITAKNYKSNRYGKTIIINGPCQIVYRPDTPLPCGAVCWVETHSKVKVSKK